MSDTCTKILKPKKRPVSKRNGEKKSQVPNTCKRKLKPRKQPSVKDRKINFA